MHSDINNHIVTTKNNKNTISLEVTPSQSRRTIMLGQLTCLSDLRAGGGGGVGMEAIADIAALFLFLIGAGGMGMFARFVGSLLEPAIPLILFRTNYIIQNSRS